ncbi:MAG: hypothetical protein O7D94_13415 [Planctomycetota bacterium]|nr:hypothetical protein [Planctomycetota bacterium]
MNVGDVLEGTDLIRLDTTTKNPDVDQSLGKPESPLRQGRQDIFHALGIVEARIIK